MTRGSKFLSSTACIFFFYVIVVNEHDPYFAFDNLVTNIASFSQLTSSVGKLFSNVSKFVAAFQKLSIAFFDYFARVEFGSLIDPVADLLTGSGTKPFVDYIVEFVKTFLGN